MINYYVVLEIPNFSDKTAIKRAYRRLSKKYHPDVNKDQNATFYFQKINEAYAFLMNENKRLLLNQYLKTVGNTASKQKENSAQHVHYQPPSKPVIYQFSTDRKFFTLGDYILIQWSVGNCKAIYINVLGKVESNGSHYLHIKQYMEEIVILMTLIGYDNQEYKYRIRLKYHNENPVIKAFHEVLAKSPKTNIEHFKKENFFLTRGRISKNTFLNRQKLLVGFLIIGLTLYSFSIAKILMFFVVLFSFWLLCVQAYKRIHDIQKLKFFAHHLLIPFYNIILLRKLMTLPSENGPSEFGLMPQQEKVTFKNWLVQNVRTKINRLNLIEKLSFTAFSLIIILGIFQTAFYAKEIPVVLTSHYVETSRPTHAGNVYKKYYLVFDKGKVQVSEKEYHTVVYNRQNSKFLVSKNRKGRIQHIVIHNKNAAVKQKLNFEVLNTSSPMLLISFILFLGQLFALRTLQGREEKPYSNGYMAIALLVYLYVLNLMI